jgi:nickel-dependent lactate racemase
MAGARRLRRARVRFSLAYGTGTYELDLPGRDAVRVAGETFPPPLDVVDAELRRSLEAPLGTIPLAKSLPGAGRIAVLISDLTRGGGTGAALAALLAWLEEAGAGPERVTVVLAMGAHRGYRAGELEAQLGAGVVSRWKVIEHNAADSDSLVDVGTTPAGTRCLFNAAVAGSPFVIALGTVSFHYFAGFGGGRKLVLPGIAGEETILANHRLSLRSDPGEGLSHGCAPGNLDGNPVHEDMLAGARLLGRPVFAVNIVSDPRGNTVFLNAGELDRSHRAACDYLSAHFRVPIERHYKAVIASAGGFPKDINLLQSHKALRHASYALDDGGVMLAAAACPDGVGSESYLASFREGRHDVPEVVRKSYSLNAQAAVSTYELTERFSIYLRSQLPDELVTRFGMCPWKDEFSPYLVEGVPDEDILVLSHAAHFLPTTA